MKWDIIYHIQIEMKRLIFTKFRLSEHKFLIEIGRNIKIPKDQRLCTICNFLEDEFNLFFEYKRTYINLCDRCVKVRFFFRYNREDKLLINLLFLKLIDNFFW
jgi:hypothetical protein